MALKPPVEVPQGAIRLNTDSQKLEFYAQDQWWEMATEGVIAPIAGRGLMFSGYTSPAPTNVIDYITISTQGNSADFGDLSYSAHVGVAMGSRTRGLYGGGQDPSGNTLNTISYVTFATQGNAADFGDMATVNKIAVGGVSDTTRGVWGGGNTPGKSDVIEYITMASTGNSIDFGNLTDSRADGGGVCSTTRGVFGGGYDPSMKDVMDYITIQSTGNAVDFGNLSQASRVTQSACSATLGVFAGGYTPTVYNNIDYITIASTGNAQDFGDLHTPAGIGGAGGSMSDSTRGVFVHCYQPGGETNTLSYITFTTKGNSIDFGDRSQSGYQGPGQTSNTHGGLG